MFNFSDKNIVTMWGIMLVVVLGSSFSMYQVGYKQGSKVAAIPQAQKLPQTAQAQPGKINPQMNMAIAVVEKVNASDINLKNVRKLSPNSNTMNQEGVSLIVNVSPSTSIERLVLKDPTIIKKDQADFQAKVDAQKKSPTMTQIIPPEPFIREKVTISEIKEGDLIMFQTVQDMAKITTGMKVNATKIDIQPSLSAKIK